MPQQKTGTFAVSLLVIALAGCQSDRFNPPPARAPAPLTPAPSGTVSGNQLPPPSQAGASQFPEAPQGPDNGQMAALDPSLGAGAGTGAGATGPEVTKNGLLGTWSVDTGGASCQMYLTLTKYGESSRGGTRRCPDELANMRSWDLSGRQVMIYDDAGNTIARLYPTGDQRLDGQTANGAPVSVHRTN